MNRLRPSRARFAFTLVELIVSMLVLGIVLLLLTQLTTALRSAIGQTTTGLREFRDARTAFETLTRRLGQATLNAYDDLNPAPPVGTAAAAYSRASELRFVCGDAGSLIFSGTTDPYPNTAKTYPYTSPTTGAAYPTDAIFFQAPLGFSQSQNAGLVQLLNTCGYYVQWGSDQNTRPAFLPASMAPRYRFRLMELLEPSEDLSIYRYTSGPSAQNPSATNSWYYFGWDWFQTPLNSSNPPVHVLAENVILLALLPMVASSSALYPPRGDKDGTSTDIAPNYYYDSSPPANGATINRDYRPQNAAHSQSALVAPYPQNQLPPLIYVQMIAVDEMSFGRYQAINGTASPTNLGLGGILNQADYQSRLRDIGAVTTALSANKIAYRLFSAAVPLSRN